MRIVFLCSGLEEGKDGVGDYVRRISSRLTEQCHTVLCIALNDSYAAYQVESEEGGQFFLRLPRGSSWKNRIRLAKARLEKFQADVVSLQYVPYGFSVKGLPIVFSLAARRLAGICNIHLMIHETWIGMDLGSSLRQRLVGKMQIEILKLLLAAIKPTWIQTSNEYYAEALEREGIVATILPLFSNVGALSESLPVSNMPVVSQPHLEVVLFGSIYPKWDGVELMGRVSRAATKLNSPVRLTVIGKITPLISNFLEALREAIPALNLHTTGTIPAEEVSLILRSADFAIAANAMHLIGKSGVIAAYREHGLPTLISRIESRGCYKGDDLIIASPAGADIDINNIIPRKRECQDTLSGTVRAFLEALGAEGNFQGDKK